MTTLIEDSPLVKELRAENERLRAALDKIAGICLGRNTGDLASAKVHKIAVDALNQ